MSDPIEQAWQAGLACLKPGEKDSEHGLELHREHLVFEVYGFAPKMAPDADAINALGVLEDIEDHILESRVFSFLDDESQRQEYRRAWQAAGVDAMVYCVAGCERSADVLVRQTQMYIRQLDALEDCVKRIAHPDEMEAGRPSVVLGSCAVPVAGEFATVARELRYVETLYDLSCRAMHLTYNRRNLLGDGCMETSNAGLSDFGRAAIAELNRFGIMVDVAHSGHRTSLEAAQISRQPIVASHTGATALHDHPRNKPDDVLKTIADGGGVIGIVALPDFVGRSGDLNAVLDHVDYVAKLVGAEHVGIGTDRAYESPRLVGEMQRIKHRGPEPFESLWPPGTLNHPDYADPAMWASTTWTNWPLITVGLVQRGYSDDQIAAIIGGNMLRLWRDLCASAGPSSYH